MRGSLAATENAIAMLPQPFVTTAQTQNENLRVALDITEEWEKLASANGSDATLITGVVVGRKDFVEQNPQLVQEFLSQYEQSVAYTQEDTAGAAALVGQYDIVPEAVAQKALPECNITFIKGEEMQAKLSAYLQTLLDQNPKSIGGSCPAMISTTLAKGQKQNRRRGVRLWAVAVWLIVLAAGRHGIGTGDSLVSPVSVLLRLLELIPHWDFWSAILFSFWRITLGFLLACLVGTALGVLSSRFGRCGTWPPR